MLLTVDNKFTSRLLWFMLSLHPLQIKHKSNLFFHYSEVYFLQWEKFYILICLTCSILFISFVCEIEKFSMGEHTPLHGEIRNDWTSFSQLDKIIFYFNLELFFWCEITWADYWKGKELRMTKITTQHPTSKMYGNSKLLSSCIVHFLTYFISQITRFCTSWNQFHVKLPLCKRLVQNTIVTDWTVGHMHWTKKQPLMAQKLHKIWFHNDNAKPHPATIVKNKDDFKITGLLQTSDKQVAWTNDGEYIS